MTADTMSGLVARLRSMCKSLTHDRSFTAAQLVLIAYAVDDAIAHIEALTAERDAFYMDYRMKADVDTKAAHIRAEKAEAALREPVAEFCRYCGAGLGKFRRDGEGTCPKCEPVKCKACGFAPCRSVYEVECNVPREPAADALVPCLRSMCKSLIHDRSFTAAQLVLIANAVEDAIARIEALENVHKYYEGLEAKLAAAEAANAALLVAVDAAREMRTRLLTYYQLLYPGTILVPSQVDAFDAALDAIAGRK